MRFLLPPALVPLAVLALAALSAPAQAQPFARAAGESPLGFAERALLLAAGVEDTHVTEVRWNGRPTVFVDFSQRGAAGYDYDERALVALMQRPDGRYDQVVVTIGEQEGGEPEVIAIGLANADHDAAQELVVMLRWPVKHLDVEGSLYEVRIFDDLKPGQARPAYLKPVSQRFAAHACDCGWSDGRRETYRFKTMALVRRELKRLGY